MNIARNKLVKSVELNLEERVLLAAGDSDGPSGVSGDSGGGASSSPSGSLGGVTGPGASSSDASVSKPAASPEPAAPPSSTSSAAPTSSPAVDRPEAPAANAVPKEPAVTQSSLPENSPASDSSATSVVGPAGPASAAETEDVAAGAPGVGDGSAPETVVADNAVEVTASDRDQTDTQTVGNVGASDGAAVGQETVDTGAAPEPTADVATTASAESTASSRSATTAKAPETEDVAAETTGASDGAAPRTVVGGARAGVTATGNDAAAAITASDGNGNGAVETWDASRQAPNGADGQGEVRSETVVGDSETVVGDSAVADQVAGGAAVRQAETGGGGQVDTNTATTPDFTGEVASASVTAESEADADGTTKGSGDVVNTRETGNTAAVSSVSGAGDTTVAAEAESAATVAGQGVGDTTVDQDTNIAAVNPAATAESAEVAGAGSQSDITASAVAPDAKSSYFPLDGPPQTEEEQAQILDYRGSQAREANSGESVELAARNADLTDVETQSTGNTQAGQTVVATETTADTVAAEAESAAAVAGQGVGGTAASELETGNGGDGGNGVEVNGQSVTGASQLENSNRGQVGSETVVADAAVEGAEAGATATGAGTAVEATVSNGNQTDTQTVGVADETAPDAKSPYFPLDGPPQTEEEQAQILDYRGSQARETNGGEPVELAARNADLTDVEAQGTGDPQAGQTARTFRNGVTIDGKDIYVDGEPFTVKGVSYSAENNGFPMAVGQSPEEVATVVDGHFADIAATGANTVRIYDPFFHDPTSFQTVSDTAEKHGLKIIVSLPTTNQEGNSAFVESQRDNRNIFAYTTGNEVNGNNFYGTGTGDPVQDSIDVSRDIHAADQGGHPIFSSFGGIPSEEDVARLDADGEFDGHSTNFYNTPSKEEYYADPLRGFSASTDKPTLVLEYGLDSYDARTGQVDEQSQASAIGTANSHLENLIEEGSLQGASVFGFRDQIHRSDGPSGAVQAFQNGTGSYSPDPAYDLGFAGNPDEPADDGVSNDEFLGITDADGNKKDAYYATRDFFGRI